MSAAPVSRSSALPEITLQSRRAPERSEPEQAFTLPQEPAERPRARLDDDRNASREGAETGEPSKSEGGRRTSAAANPARSLPTVQCQSTGAPPAASRACTNCRYCSTKVVANCRYASDILASGSNPAKLLVVSRRRTS